MASEAVTPAAATASSAESTISAARADHAARAHRRAINSDGGDEPADYYDHSQKGRASKVFVSSLAVGAMTFARLATGTAHLTAPAPPRAPQLLSAPQLQRMWIAATPTELLLQAARTASLSAESATLLRCFAHPHAIAAAADAVAHAMPANAAASAAATAARGAGGSGSPTSAAASAARAQRRLGGSYSGSALAAHGPSPGSGSGSVVRARAFPRLTHADAPAVAAALGPALSCPPAVVHTRYIGQAPGAAGRAGPITPAEVLALDVLQLTVVTVPSAAAILSASARLVADRHGAAAAAAASAAMMPPVTGVHTSAPALATAAPSAGVGAGAGVGLGRVRDAYGGEQLRRASTRVVCVDDFDALERAVAARAGVLSALWARAGDARVTTVARAQRGAAAATAAAAAAAAIPPPPPLLLLRARSPQTLPAPAPAPLEPLATGATAAPAALVRAAGAVSKPAAAAAATVPEWSGPLLSKQLSDFSACLAPAAAAAAAAVSDATITGPDGAASADADAMGGFIGLPQQQREEDEDEDEDSVVVTEAIMVARSRPASAAVSAEGHKSVPALSTGHGGSAAHAPVVPPRPTHRPALSAGIAVPSADASRPGRASVSGSVPSAGSGRGIGGGVGGSGSMQQSFDGVLPTDRGVGALALTPPRSMCLLFEGLFGAPPLSREMRTLGARAVAAAAASAAAHEDALTGGHAVAANPGSGAGPGSSQPHPSPVSLYFATGYSPVTTQLLPFAPYGVGSLAIDLSTAPAVLITAHNLPLAAEAAGASSAAAAGVAAIAAAAAAMDSVGAGDGLGGAFAGPPRPGLRAPALAGAGGGSRLQSASPSSAAAAAAASAGSADALSRSLRRLVTLSSLRPAAALRGLGLDWVVSAAPDTAAVLSSPALSAALPWPVAAPGPRSLTQTHSQQQAFVAAKRAFLAMQEALILSRLPPPQLISAPSAAATATTAVSVAPSGSVGVASVAEAPASLHGSPRAGHRQWIAHDRRGSPVFGPSSLAAGPRAAAAAAAAAAAVSASPFGPRRPFGVAADGGAEPRTHTYNIAEGAAASAAEAAAEAAAAEAAAEADVAAAAPVSASPGLSAVSTLAALPVHAHARGPASPPLLPLPPQSPPPLRRPSAGPMRTLSLSSVSPGAFRTPSSAPFAVVPPLGTRPGSAARPGVQTSPLVAPVAGTLPQPVRVPSPSPSAVSAARSLAPSTAPSAAASSAMRRPLSSVAFTGTRALSSASPVVAVSGTGLISLRALAAFLSVAAATSMYLPDAHAVAAEFAATARLRDSEAAGATTSTGGKGTASSSSSSSSLPVVPTGLPWSRPIEAEREQERFRGRGFLAFFSRIVSSDDAPAAGTAAASGAGASAGGCRSGGSGAPMAVVILEKTIFRVDYARVFDTAVSLSYWAASERTLSRATAAAAAGAAPEKGFFASLGLGSFTNIENLAVRLPVIEYGNRYTTAVKLAKSLRNRLLSRLLRQTGTVLGQWFRFKLGLGDYVFGKRKYSPEVAHIMQLQLENALQAEQQQQQQQRRPAVQQTAAAATTFGVGAGTGTGSSRSEAAALGLSAPPTGDEIAAVAAAEAAAEAAAIASTASGGSAGGNAAEYEPSTDDDSDSDDGDSSSAPAPPTNAQPPARR
jgi:hypothetical protein